MKNSEKTLEYGESISIFIADVREGRECCCESSSVRTNSYTRLIISLTHSTAIIDYG